MYRRDDGQPPRALASFAADLNGSFWAADGEFLGRMVADQTALFHPDWLRSIGAGLQHGAGELFGIPPAHAQEEEEPFRRLGPSGEELSAAEQLRWDRFEWAIQELSRLEPRNSKLTYLKAPDSVPSEAWVEELEREVVAARARRAVQFNEPQATEIKPSELRFS